MDCRWVWRNDRRMADYYNFLTLKFIMSHSEHLLWAFPAPITATGSRTAAGWVLLDVHRNRRLIRNRSPGQPPRLSHSCWALIAQQPSLALPLFVHHWKWTGVRQFWRLQCEQCHDAGGTSLLSRNQFVEFHFCYLRDYHASSVQFSSRWSMHLGKSIYLLHPLSQKFSEHCLWNDFSDCLKS